MCYWDTIRYRGCQKPQQHDVHEPRRRCQDRNCTSTSQRIRQAQDPCPRCSKSSTSHAQNGESSNSSNPPSTGKCDWWCERPICATLQTDCSRCGRKTKEVQHVIKCLERVGQGCVMDHLWNMTDGDQCLRCHPELARDPVCRFCKRTPQQRDRDRGRE